MMKNMRKVILLPIVIAIIGLIGLSLCPEVTLAEERVVLAGIQVAFPLPLCGYFCWDTYSCYPVEWTLESNKSFSDDQGGYGTWYLAGKILTLDYDSGPAVYRGPVDMSVLGVLGTMDTGDIYGRWSGINGPYGCGISMQETHNIDIDASGN